MKTANVSRDKIWWLLFTLGVVPRAPIKSLFRVQCVQIIRAQPSSERLKEGERGRVRETEREGGGEEEGKVQLNNLKLKIKITLPCLKENT